MENKKSKGFTLIELLVAIAVLVLLVMVVAQIMGGAASTSVAGRKRLDADSVARMVFDRMADDFAGMVKRPDVDYLIDKVPGNDAIYFYSKAPAFTSSTTGNQAPISFVGYRVNQKMQLERLAKGLTWNEVVFLTYTTQPPTTSSTPSGGTFRNVFASDISGTDNTSVIGDGVFRVEFTFLLKPHGTDGGVYSTAPWDSRANNSSLNSIGLSDVQAIVVTIAILDAQSREILPDVVSNLTSVAQKLTDAANGATPANAWRDAIANPSSTSLPLAAASQLRIYQRTFPLNTL